MSPTPGRPVTRRRRTDRRLLVTYTLLVVVALFSGWRSDRNAERLDKTAHQLSATCRTQLEGFLKVNAALDQLARSASSNPARAATENQQVAQEYASLHLPVTACPPR